MITEHQKFRLPDLAGTRHLDAEVNWNEHDEDTNQCKVIRLTLPDGGKAYIKRDDLNHILFAIGDVETQRNLVPQRLTTVHWRDTVLGIKATKNIAKGEMMNFPIKISFPCTNVRQVIGTNTWKKDVAREQKKDTLTTQA